MTRPPPLRTDGSNGFAHHTMRVRVPRIARDVVEREKPPARACAAIEQLARDVEENRPLPAPRGPSPDVEAWTASHAEHPGESWLAAEWFHAEHVFYRELAHACRFWETGADPFAGAKEQELSSERPWSRLAEATAGRGRREERVMGLLGASLWGNRVDLSYAAASDHGSPGDSDLLVDERSVALPWLLRAGTRVHLVADNTGTELVLDLSLIDALLEDTTTRVTVHLKAQPVFVSDATVRDVWRALERMQQRGGDAGAMASHLQVAFDDERLRLAPDPFWSGSRFLWRAPEHLAAALGDATLVVVKGDANYRRIVGDAMWPPEVPLAHVADYLRSPVLCLRTMKSDPVVGLPAGLAGRLDATEPRWRIDGRRGVAQAVVPSGVC
jgi:uncharacterized protein with ATP-grasp and redox domains